jgi:NADH-quinone oxidoreductase subunit H
MIGETNRLPFDLPEAEGELVSGYMTEYSSMKFAWFFLAEYINMINVSAVATTLFLGGWRAPWPLSAIGDGVLNTGWWPVLWFLAKMWMFMFLFVWVRGTLLRLRYDQFMKFGWKILIPAALAWVVMVAVVQGVRQFTDVDLQTLLLGLGVAMLVFVGISYLVPQRPEPAPEGPATGEFDPFAGGYPVPPLPGQTLPPSPRRRARLAAGGPAGGSTGTATATPPTGTPAVGTDGAPDDRPHTDTEVQRG